MEKPNEETSTKGRWRGRTIAVNKDEHNIVGHRYKTCGSRY